MTKRIQPRSGFTYTFKQITELLDLRDSPCLMFPENEQMQNIQDSHISAEDTLKLEHWADSRWKYQYETDEWVPIFYWADDNTVTVDQLLDKEPMIDPFIERAGVLWCVPKGTERAQYHKIVKDEDGTEWITDGYGTDRYPVPKFDEEGKSEHHYRRVNNPGRCDYCKGQAERRFNYRDPSEGNCKLYEICRPCLDRAHKAMREEFADGYDD